VCDRLQSSASGSHNREQATCQPSSGWLRGDRDVRAGTGRQSLPPCERRPPLDTTIQTG
jgi:hypothetical protein